MPRYMAPHPSDPPDWYMLDIPELPCPACDGTGRDGDDLCEDCDGTGLMPDEDVISLLEHRASVLEEDGE